MRFFATRYRAKPQALNSAFITARPIRLGENIMLISGLKALLSDLHDEELDKVGEVHLQKVILLHILELWARA
jgi:hypothetical protein